MNPSRSLRPAGPAHNPRSAGSTPLTEIAISGTGLACQAGDQPFALFGAIATCLSGSTPHDDLCAQGSGKGGAGKPILIVPVAGLENLDTPQERISTLAGSALQQALESLPPGSEEKDLLVLTLIPEEGTARRGTLDLEQLQSTLKNQHSGLATACFRFASPDQGAVKQLSEACTELAEGKWQLVLFGGADSLVDIATCTSLIQENKAMPRGGAGGVIPGEAAAYLLLEKSPNKTNAPVIYAMAAAEEPHTGQADLQKMTGLATALNHTLSEANLTPADIKSIALPLGGNRVDDLEWHQVVENLWSRRENIPREFEEMKPYTTLGDTGAAKIPLALVLGFARLEFHFPSVSQVLVCEASHHSPRGALCLKPGAAGNGAQRSSPR